MRLTPGMDAPLKTLTCPSTSTAFLLLVHLPNAPTAQDQHLALRTLKSSSRHSLGRPLALCVCLVVGIWFLTPLFVEWSDEIHFTPRFTLPPLQDVFRGASGVHVQPELVMGVMPAKLDDWRLWNQRAAQVRDAYLHGYNHYLRYAAGHDELLPLSNGWQDKYVLCPTSPVLISIVNIASMDGALRITRTTQNANVSDPGVSR